MEFAEENAYIFQHLAIREEWKEIKGHPLYEVSDFGRIRSWHYNRWGKAETERILTPATRKDGYKSIQLGRAGKPTLLHRLVAEAFIPNPDNLPCVLHGDNDRSNNFASNLRWGTQSDNIKQGVEDGNIRPDLARQARLDKCPTYTLIHKSGEVRQVKNISDFSRRMGISNGNLYQMLSGKRNSAGGWRLFAQPSAL